MNERRRLLFGLDLDETVVEWHQDPVTSTKSWTISDAVRESITSVIDAGHEVVVVTGRSLEAIGDVLEVLDISHGYAVCSNGAVIVELSRGLPDGVRILRTIVFDPLPIEIELRRRFPGARLGLVTVEGFAAPDGYIPMWASTLTPVDRASEVLNMFGKVPHDNPQEVVAVASAHGHTVYWDDLPGEIWLDIVGPGCSKGAGLAWIAERLEIDQADSVAVGDGVNDVDMLAWAGVGIAMGNSSPRVQGVADWITLTVAEDGVAHALRTTLSSHEGVQPRPR